MCYEEGRLMEYLDGEVTGDERAEMQSHLRGCPSCESALSTLAADRDVAAGALARLKTADEETAAAAAGVSSAAALAATPTPAGRVARSRLARIGWPRIAAAAAAVIVAASLSLAPVRGAVADFLKVFRVQKVQVISMSAADLKTIGDTLKNGSGHVNLKAMGDVWISGPKATPKIVTLAEAQGALDFPVRLPSPMSASPTLTLRPAETYEFKLKVDAINQVLKYYGSDRTLPAALDGKVFTVKMPAILLATYAGTPTAVSAPTPAPMHPEGGRFDENAIFVGQARSPELIVPDGVDPAQLREVLLNLPFLPQSVRDQLAAVSDWQSTLLVPDIGGAAHNTTIDGVPAVVMDRPSMPRLKQPGSTVPQWVTVVFNQNGVVRAIGGPTNEETAIGMAKSMMR